MRMRRVSLLLFLACAGAWGHMLRNTWVTLSFAREGWARADVAVDPSALGPHVAGAAHPAVPELPREALEKAARAYADSFGAKNELRVDGRPVAWHLDRVDLPEMGRNAVGSRPVALSLSGRFPDSALRWEWHCGAVLAPFLLIVKGPGEAADVHWLGGGASVGPLPLTSVAESMWTTAWAYLQSGFRHIVPGGWDHMLFLLGLWLACLRLRPVLLLSLVFTLAHSMSLGLAAAGAVQAPARWVEPLIALTIGWVGLENWLDMRRSNIPVTGRETGPGRSRVAATFAFGLIHGLGFAGALREQGLPQGRFLLGLLSFNAGVEAGQAAFLILVMATLGISLRYLGRYRNAAISAASAGLAATGLTLCLARALGWA